MRMEHIVCWIWVIFATITGAAVVMLFVDLLMPVIWFIFESVIFLAGIVLIFGFSAALIFAVLWAALLFVFNKTIAAKKAKPFFVN